MARAATAGTSWRIRVAEMASGVGGGAITPAGERLSARLSDTSRRSDSVKPLPQAGWRDRWETPADEIPRCGQGKQIRQRCRVGNPASICAGGQARSPAASALPKRSVGTVKLGAGDSLRRHLR